MRLGAGAERAELIKLSDNWTRSITQLLNDLLEKLSETVNSYKKFRQRDYGYFQGIQDVADRAYLSLHSAETAFEALRDCEEKLIRLKERCRDYRRDVSEFKTSTLDLVADVSQ